MSQPVEMTVIYDGECFFCRTFTRLQKADPKLVRINLVDARHEMPAEVLATGLDIDKGMIVMFQDRVYHGADALHAVALVTGRSDFFNRMMFRVFSSKALTDFLYPSLRFYRDMYLWIANKPKINKVPPGDLS